MKRWLGIPLACLAIAAAGAGCGGDDDSDGGGDKAEKTQPAKTDAAPGTKTVEVSMKDIKFVPHDVTVAKGSKVVWTNDDKVPHTVTKEGGPGPDFDSKNVEAGKTYELTFDTPGKIDYVCTLHPGQDGTVTVR